MSSGPGLFSRQPDSIQYTVSVQKIYNRPYTVLLKKKVGQVQIQQQKQFKDRMATAYRAYANGQTLPRSMKSILSNPLKIRTKTILESKLKRHIQNYPLLAPSLLEYFKKIICNNKQRAQVLNKQGLGELTTIYTNYKVFLYDKFKILTKPSEDETLLPIFLIYILKKIIQQALNDLERENPDCFQTVKLNEAVKRCFETLKGNLTSDSSLQKILRNITFIPAKQQLLTISQTIKFLQPSSDWEETSTSVLV